jgi:hypothetical protein
MKIFLSLVLALPLLGQTKSVSNTIATGVVDNSTATHTLPARSGTTAGKPATCTVGEEYFATDATPGQNKFFCTATNVWTQQLNSGGGGGATIPSVTSIIKGDGAGNGANTKVAIASPTTAATLSFPTDNATITFQGSDTYVGRATADVFTNKTFDTAGAGNVFKINTNALSAVEGNTAKVQTFAGADPATNDCAKFDAGHNLVTAGAPCGAGGGGATMASQLGDLAVVRTNSTTLTIGTGCSASTPCNVRFGDKVYSIITTATAVISAGTGIANIYVDSAGTLTVAHNVTLACTNCTAIGGGPTLPTTIWKVGTWTATSATWDVSGGVDQRAFAGTKNVACTNGLLQTDLNGLTTCSVDPERILLTCPTTSASGTAEVCNTSPTFTPQAGDSVIFQADIANTGAFTLNVNSLGAKAVKKNGTAALVANDILASPFQALLTYDGTNWEMQGQTGNASSGGSSVTCDPFVAGNDCRTMFAGANTTTSSGASGLQFYPVTGTGGSFPMLATTSTFVAGGIVLTTGTTSTNASNIIYTNGGGFGGTAPLFDPITSTGTWKWVSTGQLSATTSEQVLIGLTNGASCTSNQSSGSGNLTCIGIEFDTGQSDTNWTCVYKAPFAAGSRLSIGVAPDTALHTFTIEKVDGTHMKCSVDATTVTLTVANPNGAPVFPIVKIETTNTTSKTFTVGAIIKYWRTGLGVF